MSASEAGGRGFGQIVGLDGLRAVSVLVVMLYHAHAPWMRGGYLGVEVFFVISGFLITSLLRHEWERTGTVRLRAFWGRRFRRLLPALFSVLAFVALVGAHLLGGDAAQFRGDLLASLLYVENWHQVYAGSSYFADHGYPLLRHIWSLAVEEQFYLLWPLWVAALLALGRGRRALLTTLTALLALGSLVLMAVLAKPFLPSALAATESLNRAYLGTDTRAAGLLLGALLALAPPGELRGGARRLLDALSLLSLAGLLVLASQVDIQSPFLYRGGLLLVDLLTLVALLGLTRAEGALTSRLLALKPLAWVGLRSYGIYLWHWPIFKLVEPRAPTLTWVLARWVLTFLVAELSYRFFEMPIRSGRFGEWLRNATPTRPWRWAGVGLASALGLACVAQAGRRLVKLPPYVDEIQAAIAANAAALDDPSRGPTEPQYEGLRGFKPMGGPGKSAPSIVPLPEIPREPLAGLRVTAIGDSVMKGAALALRDLGDDALGTDGLLVNAEESRGFARAAEVVAAYRQEGRLGEVVVIHLGANNSRIPEAQFQRLADLLADRRLVIYLNAKSDKTDACRAVNAELARLVQRTGNGRLLDWMGIGEAHPEIFYTDDTHIRPEGARFYAATILAAIARHLQEAPRVPGVPPPPS